MPGGRRIRRLRQIDHQQRSGTTPKAFDFEFQKSSPGLTNRAYPAHQVAGFIPAFERAGFASSSEDELIGTNRQRIFSRFDQDRLGSRLEESLNRIFNH